MKNLKHVHTKTVLLQWVVTCIIILLIPFVSIIINFFIGRNIINKQIQNSNHVIMNHMQNAIDDKLQSIQNLSYLLLLDNNLLKLSEASDSDDFLSQAQICYNELNHYNYIYNDLNMIIYYPSRNYMITSGVANETASIYNAMNYSYHGEMISYEEWMSVIGADYSKSCYFFNDYCNYNNIGKKSFVFACTSPFVYQEDSKYNILVSSTADFIESDLAELTRRTFFICDRDGNVIQQFGTRIENVSALSFSSSEEYTNIDLNEEKYFCYSIASAVTGWNYVLCTPSSLYLRDSVWMRNVTLISTFASLVVGIFIVLYTQYRNYRPVKKLVDVIPNSIKGGERDEFRQIELYHGEMSRLNLFMQNKLDNISKNVRELYFYSKLKGVNFHTQEKDIINTLKLDFSGKQFVIVSVYADSHSFSNDDVMRNWELLHFAIQNVSDEILTKHFDFETIQDEFFHVFFFALDEDKLTEWNLCGFPYFKQLYDFFNSQFHIPLFITISPVYESFEQTADYYADMISSFEEYYAKKLPGVYLSIKHNRDVISNHLEFGEYSRNINLSIFQNDYKKACEIVHDYISDLKTYNFSKIIVRYNIYSLIASILMDTGDYINQVTRDTIDCYLSDSFDCDTYEEYEDKMNHLLLYLCNQSDSLTDTAQGREAQIVKKVKNYVDNYYSDPNLNVASVADAVNLSPNYMSKIFKNLTGEGLLSYINRVRINHAKELLRITNINIDEIALMVGFSNTRSFRRNFQNLTGITASDYRNGAK